MTRYPPQRTPSFLDRLVSAQSNRCHYCDLEFGPAELEAAPSRDHIVPKSKGGTNTPHNFVAACLRCNQVKGNLSAVEFKALISKGQLRARRDLNKLWQGRRRIPSSDALLQASLRTLKERKGNPPRPKLGDIVRAWDKDRFT